MANDVQIIMQSIIYWAVYIALDLFWTGERTYCRWRNLDTLSVV